MHGGVKVWGEMMEDVEDFVALFSEWHANDRTLPSLLDDWIQVRGRIPTKQTDTHTHT